MVKASKEYANRILKLLQDHYPNAKMILNWVNNFELLVAITLSAKCTDKKVTEVTSTLFPKYRKEKKELKEKYKQYTSVILVRSPKRTNPESDSGHARMTTMIDPHVAYAPQDNELDIKIIIQLINFAEVHIEELEQDIKSTGFYHNKAKNVKEAEELF